MLEIIALIFLTRKIGTLATQKGLKPGTWKLYAVLLWFGAEIAGVIITLAMLGTDAVVPAILIGLCAAVGSYFILSNNLSKRPDADDDINYIGHDIKH